LSAVTTIGIAALVAAAIWEASNALMDRQLNVLSRDGQFARAARLRTFSRCADGAAVPDRHGGWFDGAKRNRRNVAPLLAGAGIVGIAMLRSQNWCRTHYADCSSAEIPSRSVTTSLCRPVRDTSRCFDRTFVCGPATARGTSFFPAR